MKTGYKKYKSSNRRWSNDWLGHSGSPEKIYVPKCKICRVLMVIRINRGEKKTFWGCKHYPECKFTRAMEKYRWKNIKEIRKEENDEGLNTKKRSKKITKKGKAFARKDWGVGMINKRLLTDVNQPDIMAV